MESIFLREAGWVRLPRQEDVTIRDPKIGAGVDEGK